MFKKYHKLINHYEDTSVKIWCENYPDLLTEDFVITEKIHGCNFQIYTDGNVVRFGSRNGWIEHGLYNIMDHVWKIEELINELMGVSLYCEQTITLYGEYYGGSIHKEINYGEKSFRFFAVAYDGKKSPFCRLLSLMETISMRKWVVPILDYKKGVFEALDINENFNSTIAEQGEFAEGVVIEPLNKVYKYADKYFVLKKKADKFLEVMKLPKKQMGLSADILEWNAQFKNLIVDARLQNIFSKEGVIKENKDIGKYVKLLIEDAKEEFFCLYPDFNVEKNEEKNVFKIGNSGFNLIKKYL